MTSNQTAEMPMPGGETQLRLLRVMDNNNPIYQICQELPLLAKELRKEKDAAISTSRMCEDLEKDNLHGWPMVVLLLSMSQSAIKSIIGGTVAFDANKSDCWYDQPSSGIKGAGIYVIGLARKNSGGKFLNGAELRDLINGLEQYIRGAKVINSSSNVGLSAQQLEDKKWTMKVDGIYRQAGDPTDGSVAQFIKKNGEKSIQELVTSFKRRVTNLDTTNTVRQIQSPLYVGCSIDLNTRVNNYYRNLRDTNKPLCLTVSVLEALNLKMDIIIKIALRTWKDEQLPLAERLVTTLARSLVHQTGFNATQAGANSTSPTRSVLSLGWRAVNIKGFLTSNSNEMEVEMDKRELFLDKLQELNQKLELA
ncbi:Ff.00g061620.m01.CDS01 [Fusarium sp. VM40]|nr:Ff.00g061620.m01.CDS01 [Fusarium sp. VM40]